MLTMCNNGTIMVDNISSPQKADLCIFGVSPLLHTLPSTATASATTPESWSIVSAFSKMVFCNGLFFSFNIMLLRFIHVLWCICSSFLRLPSGISMNGHTTVYPFMIDASVVSRLRCCKYPINAMYICVCMCTWVFVLYIHSICIS